MPFKSKAQRRYMYANYPKIAQRWSKHTPKNTKLPEYVKETLNECYELKNTVLTDGGHEATVFFVLTKAPGAELGMVFDTSNPEMPPDYIQGVIRDNNEKQMHSFEDPNEAAELLSKYGLEPQNVEEEMYQQAVEEIESNQAASATDDGVRMESLEFESLYTKILNS
jgi:hypothetical protein